TEARRARRPRALRRAVAGTCGNRTHPTRRRQVAAVLKTARATRPHPLPNGSRYYDVERRTCFHRADFGRALDARKILGHTGAWQRDEEAARRLRIDEQRAIHLADGAPVDASLEILVVALGAARCDALFGELARARQDWHARQSDAQRDVARARDVRHVPEQSESGDVGSAPGTGGERGAARAGIEARHALDHDVLRFVVEPALFRRRRENARAERLREHEYVAGNGARIGEQAARIG